jgi:HEPN domain-containing protein
MDEVRQSALEWIAKARRDMEAAKRMIDCADPLLDTGAYHCQQAAEKALKGWLTFHGTGVIKTHDLVHLIRECARMDSGFLELIEMADFLSPFAVDFRYPGDLFEPPKEEADAAMHFAEKIVVFVEGKIGSHPCD